MQADREAGVPGHPGQRIGFQVAGEPVDVGVGVPVRDGDGSAPHAGINACRGGQFAGLAADDHRRSVGQAGRRRVVWVQQHLGLIAEVREL